MRLQPASFCDLFERVGQFLRLCSTAPITHAHKMIFIARCAGHQGWTAIQTVRPWYRASRDGWSPGILRAYGSGTESALMEIAELGSQIPHKNQAE
jgi:hypothetical protein